MPICWIVGPSVRLYLLFLKRAPIEALVSFIHSWRCLDKSNFLDLPLLDLWMWSLYITDLFPHSPPLWICTLTSYAASADHFNPVWFKLKSVTRMYWQTEDVTSRLLNYHCWAAPQAWRSSYLVSSCANIDSLLPLSTRAGQDFARGMARGAIPAAFTDLVHVQAVQ